MKILVTGGLGFIGSHICDIYIENGHDVVIVDNAKHGKRENLNPKAKLYEIDIRDKELYKVFEKENIDVVCHHAAQISVPNSIKDPMEDLEINLVGTLNLLECCKDYKVNKVIYPASAAIFGEPKYLPIDENHPLNMMCGYGVTKHTVEHYLKVYKTLYDIDYTVFRYANVYGPRQDASGEGGVVAIFSEKFLTGEAPCIFGDGKQTRDFVYVKDIAVANLLALDSLNNDIFNVATNVKVTVNDLVSTFSLVLKKDLKVEYKEERIGDIKNNYMTYDKINKACGWKPSYSFEKGLKETLTWYESRSNLED